MDFKTVAIELQRALDVNQTGLAEILGVGQSSISRYTSTSGPAGDAAIKFFVLRCVLSDTEELALAKSILAKPLGATVLNAVLTLGCPFAAPLLWAEQHKEQARQELSKLENIFQKSNIIGLGTLVSGLAALPVVGTVGAFAALLSSSVLANLGLSLWGTAKGKRIVAELKSVEKGLQIRQAREMKADTISGILKCPAAKALRSVLEEMTDPNDEECAAL